MRRRTGPTPRAGYTLVELLIVIAIIAILAALLTSALSRVRQAAKKTTATSEINQLDTALTNFQLKHGFYPPSHVGYTNTFNLQVVGLFRIPEAVYDPTNPSLSDAQRREVASLNILRRMFPRWNPNPNNLPLPHVITPALQAPTINGVLTRDLDPNQAMVYFLGGPGTLLGASSGLNPGWDTASPYAPTGNTRIDPYYSEFNDARLKDETGDFNGGAAGHDGRYRDPWGIPYAYFVCNAGSDQYDVKLQFPWPASEANAASRTFNPDADVNKEPTNGTKTNTAHPIATTVTLNGATYVYRWANPKKFQIVSAGPDKVFGRGSFNPDPATDVTPPKSPNRNKADYWAWKPGTSEEYGEGSKGEDDIANFNSGTALGAQGAGQ
jgi:prepilin-type N-terminal cleavage/methylation domain-containing protein